MAKKTVSQIPKICGTYRIPLRKVYNAKHTRGDPSWDDIYGKKRCANCNKHFQEGDAYRMTKDNNPYHVDCEIR